MEDDHVDRPGVEVRQRMQLTGTNSSIDLIVLIASAHLGKAKMVLVPSRLFRPSGGAAGGAAHKRRRPVGLAGFARDASRLKQNRILAARNPASQIYMHFADLVVMAGWLHPIPFRTRP